MIMIIIINSYQLRIYYIGIYFPHITITYIRTIIYYYIYIYTHCIYTELSGRSRPYFHAVPAGAYSRQLYIFAMLYIHILSHTIILNVFILLFPIIILAVLSFPAISILSVYSLYICTITIYYIYYLHIILLHYIVYINYIIVLSN